MNIFWILLALVMVVLGILTLVAIPCILWFGRKRSWRFRLTWVGLSCLPLGCFIWFVGWSSAYEPSDRGELARGFEFELHAKGNGAEPLVAGGRYDGLLTRLGSKTPIPAVGFSVWIEALAQAGSAS